MIIYLDRQHAGKPTKISDRGAGSDINGNGKIDTDEMEAMWTGYLSLILENRLLSLGHHVMPLSDGNYSDRHNRVNEYSKLFPNDKQVYIALHLNCGGGDYCAMFHHFQSSQGKQLADMICDEMKKCIPLGGYKSIPAQSTDWTEHAYNTIRGIGKPVAICSEPIFMDTHKHLISQDNFAKIALAMSTAIHNWGK